MPLEDDVAIESRTMRTHRASVHTALLALLACVLTTPAVGQSDALAGFDAYVARGVEQWRLPGLALAVVKDGRVVYAKGYGVRELGKAERVDEHTLFAVGSTTKAMTAALIGMLVDEQKLAWDDPVTRHLPGFQLKDAAVTRELTVRDLLTHRGGLGNADFLWYGQENSTEQILDRVRLIEPAYSLRSRFIYQNVMYAAAGRVIEQITGQPWKEVIQARIFGPLGMRETVATLSQVVPGANVASPHSTVNGTVKVIRNVSVDPVPAAGAVWSNASDMAKWMQFLLDGGRVGGPDGKQLLSERTVAELFRPQTMVPDSMYPTTRLVKPHWMTYALGWFQQDYRGRAVDFHTGSIDGMIAMLGLIRDERLGVLVLGNLDHAELRHALMYTVFDRYAGRSDRDWSAALLELYGEADKRAEQARARMESQQVKGTSPSLPLDSYAGSYKDTARGQVDVTFENGRLHLRYGPGFIAPLEHWHFNTFRAAWDADWRGSTLVNFTLGAASGRVDGLEMMGGRFTRADR
jgi:CubicO group peptidase (beta-lactamase class C family)